MQNSQTTKARFESLFGSDSSIGVMMEVVFNDTNKPPELLLMEDFFSKYGDAAGDQNSSLEYSSVMPDGTSATCCTNYAHHIRKTLEPLGHAIEVAGFANEDNPESKCAKEEYHPGGHDFALVDGRYLVDPWVRLVACVEDQIVYDLNDQVDATKALDIYGPKNCWKRFDGQRFSAFVQ